MDGTVKKCVQDTFQSTPPMQGATARIAPLTSFSSCVSIHAPYAGSDLLNRDPFVRQHLFQSTPPMQGATIDTINKRIDIYVSIHAPYAGSDGIRRSDHRCACSVSIHAPYAGSDHDTFICDIVVACFNPRPLCRERPECAALNELYCMFQSTPPMQGATTGRCFGLNTRIVSIHAPYAGSDQVNRCLHFLCRGFNPRPLCRERHSSSASL